MRSFMICNLEPNIIPGEIKEAEKGWACGTYGKRGEYGKCIHSVWWEILKGSAAYTK